MLDCKICKNQLPLDCFYQDARLKRGYDNRCKKCRIAYNLKYYRESTWDGTIYISEIKKAGCAKCGMNKEKCLDFHHMAGKDFTIGSRRRLKQELIDEIAKCIILCANCHRLHHAGELDVSDVPLITPISLEEFLKKNPTK